MHKVTVDFSSSPAAAGVASGFPRSSVGKYVTRDVFLTTADPYELISYYKVEFTNFSTGQRETRIDDFVQRLSPTEYSFAEGTVTVEEFGALFGPGESAARDYNAGLGGFFGTDFVRFDTFLPREPSIFDMEGVTYDSVFDLDDARSEIREQKGEFLTALGDVPVRYYVLSSENGAAGRVTFVEDKTLADLGYGTTTHPFGYVDAGFLRLGVPDESVLINGSRFGDGFAGSIENDTIYGHDGNDRLSGNWGDDLLVGGAGDDTLTGSLGVDTLLGGRGNDTFLVDFEGSVVIRDEGRTRILDVIDGGAGIDTLMAIDTLSAFESYTLNDGTPDNFVLSYSNQYDLTVKNVEFVAFELFEGDVETQSFLISTEDLFILAQQGNLFSGGPDWAPTPIGGGGGGGGGGSGGGNSGGGNSGGGGPIVGGPGGGTIEGGAGADTIIIIPCEDDEEREAPVRVIGAEGDDYVYALQNDKLLFDPCDNLHVDGGKGNDYVYAFGANDTVFGGEGADTLSGAGGDDLIFGDVFEVRYAMAEANQVFRLYQATFNRGPDAAGHADWTAQLFQGDVTLAQVRDGFVGSREFTNVYGALDDAGLVKRLYINVLNRDFDQGEVTQAEVDSWTSRISDTFTRADVVNGFAESRELINTTTAAANAQARESSPAAWMDDVYRLYQATLNRAPDAAGFASWADNLADGQALSQVIAGFTNSREFSNVYGVLAEDEDFVKLLYNNVLSRDFAQDEVSQDEIDSWTGQLSDTFTRSDIVAGFSQSREFIQNTAADVKAYVRGLGIDDRIEGGAGSNTISGGTLADQFVFEQAEGSTNRVLDLETWDYVVLQGFGYETSEQARSHLTQGTTGAVFEDQGTRITFDGVQVDAVTDDMILI